MLAGVENEQILRPSDKRKYHGDRMGRTLLEALMLFLSKRIACIHIPSAKDHRFLLNPTHKDDNLLVLCKESHARVSLFTQTPLFMAQ